MNAILAQTAQSPTLQDALAAFLIALLPVALALFRAWSSEQAAKLARSSAANEQAKAEASRLEAEASAMAAAARQAALDAVVLGVQRYKATLTPVEAKRTNGAIQAVTLEAGVEGIVSAVVDRIKGGGALTPLPPETKRVVRADGLPNLTEGSKP